jgi:hypothetical protein
VGPARLKQRRRAPYRLTLACAATCAE